QFGNAELPANQIGRSGKVNGYEIFFDDRGKMLVGTSGALRTEIAYYRGEGQPTTTVTAPGRFGYPRIKNIRVGPNRNTLYIGVRALDRTATGTYGLFVRGVPEGMNYPLEISSETFTASSDTDINSPNDYDFWEFTTPRAGNWTVTVGPDDSLDATLIVYDSEGNPVYGGFSQAMNTKPIGVAEKWVGRNLPAHSTYYVRVDGSGDSTGDYDIFVQGIPRPSVSVVARARLAPKTGLYAGQFTFERSRQDDLRSPLTIQYSLSGTAKMGIDYKPLSGVVTIPANQTTATVTITPIAQILTQPGKTVILRILSNKDYVTVRPSATLVITDHPA
ncbi:MAG: hypothetical protein ACM359_03040, partial [Bacillota bacterium]